MISIIRLVNCGYVLHYNAVHTLAALLSGSKCPSIGNEEALGGNQSRTWDSISGLAFAIVRVQSIGPSYQDNRLGSVC